ncbi:MAG TPA: hypothetical protein VK588_17045, partial [Chitinophagaceae bacterium]|nr:hypothetical protein [Chitinophagaceae bacterium]
GLTFLVEIAAILFVEVMGGKSNQWLYNLFVPVEFICYGYFYLNIVTTRWIRKFILFLMIVFPVAGLASTIVVFKFYDWNSYQAIGEALFTIFFAVSYYYELYVSPETFKLKNKPEFWIATGMIIFYSYALPFLGTINYLDKVSHSLASTLLDVFDYVDILMYLIFCYAFLCRIITRK